MNSLRVRLILGFAFVALVPVALLVGLMAGRIRSSVRAQADERLTGALAALHAQLEGQQLRLGEKLGLLAEDAELKRLYLVQAATDAGLREHLSTQQFLLGLDYLGVTDTAGILVADGAAAATTRMPDGREPLPLETLPRLRETGATLVVSPARHAVVLDAAAAIRYRGEPVGLVRGGLVLDSLRLAGLRETSGVELALTDNAGQVITSTLAKAGTRIAARGDAAQRIQSGRRSFLARSDTLALGGGGARGSRHSSRPPRRTRRWRRCRAPRSYSDCWRWRSPWRSALLWSLQISRPVERLAAFSQRIALGEWDEPLALASVRELQTLVQALDRMRRDLRDYRDRLVASERQAA